MVISTSDIRHAVAIAFDPVDQFVYWSDVELKAIFRYQLHGSGKTTNSLKIVENYVDWNGKTVVFGFLPYFFSIFAALKFVAE